MLSRRALVIVALILLPILVYVGLGAYAIWATDLTLWVWGLPPACWLLAWAVAKFWVPPELQQFESPAPARHWTDRDRAALEVIRRHQLRVAEFSPEELIDPHFHLEQIKKVAMDLAEHYRPDSVDPYSSLKISEVLSAMHLAIEDLEDLSLDKFPIAQWLTIGQWQALGHAPKWYNRAHESVWLTSVLYNPLNLLRYVTSKATVESLSHQVQQELLMRLYMRFISKVGFYLIEMNSGRLRGGTRKYREYFQSKVADTGNRQVEDASSGSSVGSAEPVPVGQAVNLVLIGQVSAGKSSLVNALTTKRQAKCDVLPTTREVSRFSLEIPGASGNIQLLDTPGYGEAGASPQQFQQIEIALKCADAVLLVMAANTSARKPDQMVLTQLEEYYRKNPDLKFPPVVGILSHVDRLKPSLVWAPPYDWQSPSDAKGQNIQAALRYAADVLGQRVKAIVPVCTAEDESRQWGVTEEVLPALANLLTDAQATSLLRLFNAELNQSNWRRIVGDLKQTGRSLLEYWHKSASPH